MNGRDYTSDAEHLATLHALIASEARDDKTLTRIFNRVKDIDERCALALAVSNVRDDLQRHRRQVSELCAPWFEVQR